MLPVLLLEPSTAVSKSVCALLREAAVPATVASDADAAVFMLATQVFSCIVISADLSSEDCVHCLQTIRRKAPRTWMVVVAPEVTEAVESQLHRLGVDASLSIGEYTSAGLIRRPEALAIQRRPDFLTGPHHAAALPP